MLTAVFYKIKAITGGFLRLAVLLLCCTLCFGVVNGILTSGRANEISIAMVDGDCSDTSRALYRRLAETAGLNVFLCDEKRADTLLHRGRTEAVLTVESGYENAFLKGRDLPLRLTFGSGTNSAKMTSEIIGGAVLAMQSRNDAVNRLKADDLWNPENEAAYDDCYREAEREALPLALFISGEENADPLETSVFGEFYARYSGFSGLLLMLVVFSLSVWRGEEETRKVNLRCEVLPSGGALAKLTDGLAMFLIAALVSLCALLVKGSGNPAEYLAYGAYSVALTGIGMLLARAQVSGGVQTGAAYLALLTSALGGCFFDLTSLGGIFRVLPLLTPQGHLIAAVSGSALSALILLLLGAAACLLA